MGGTGRRMGPAPMRVPRQAMLCELGLVAELSPEADARPLSPRPAAPAEGVLSEAKVGRNDPCPCGSGRKYKRCCGR